MLLKRIILGLSIMISTTVILIGVTEDKAYAEEYSSPTVNVTAMAPETYYVHDTYLAFSGSSAPSTMYYQRQIYGRLYRGYLTRNWNIQIIWGPNNTGVTAYSGTLYRNDLPFPIPSRLILESPESE